MLKLFFEYPLIKGFYSLLILVYSKDLVLMWNFN